MAGLDECCTHVSATLFYVDSTIRIRNAKTCTGEKPYWRLPANLVDVPYKPVRELDFTSSKTMRQKHDTVIKEHCSNSSTQEHAVPKPKNKVIPNPTETEVTQFLTNISKCGTKPAILSLVSDSFVPKEYGNDFPILITDLTDSTTFNLSHSELLDKCKNIKQKLFVSKEQSITREKETR